MSNSKFMADVNGNQVPREHPPRLRQFIDIKHGFAFSSDFYADSGHYVLLTPGNFREEGGFRWLAEKQKYYSGDVPEEYVLRADQMLIAMTEQAPGLLGSTFFVPPERVYLHNQRLGLVTIKDENAVCKGYLHYFFSSEPIRRQIAAESAGTKVKHTSPDKLLDLSIILPPLEEQIEVAAILQTWDEAIEKLEELLQTKTQRRDGIVQELFSPSQPSRKTKGWRHTTFGEAFTERQDRNCGLGSECVVTVGKYAIRKQAEHFTRSVASADLSNYWVISPGDFVYDPMSAYYGALGQYTGESDGIVSPAYRVIQLRANVLPGFMIYLLKSHRIKFLLESRSSQGNKEGKRRLLQRDEFANIDFLLPPVEEQQRISAIVSTFEQDLAGTSTQLEKVKSQKRGLMQKLLTGQWKVTR